MSNSVPAGELPEYFGSEEVPKPVDNQHKYSRLVGSFTCGAVGGAMVMGIAEIFIPNDLPLGSRIGMVGGGALAGVLTGALRNHNTPASSIKEQ